MISWRLEKPFYYLLLCFFFLLPDISYAFIDGRFPICFNPEKLGLLCLFAVTLSFVKSIKFVCIVLGVFGGMQLFQFASMAYFGTYLSPFALLLMFSELTDVVREVWHVIGNYWYLPFIIFIPYALYVLRLTTVYRRRIIRDAWIFPTLFIVVFLVQSNTQLGFFKMAFRQSCYASFNTMNTYAAFVGNILPRSIFPSGRTQAFKPYEVKLSDKVEEANVIVIFGESLNRNHMSLFGYERPTTPLLKKRAEKDKGLVYKKAIAGAVNTFIAVPSFLHLQREPQNFKKQIQSDTYLPKLAQQNGFKTYYVGFQGEETSRKTGISFMDESFVYSPIVNFNELEFFMDAFSKINLSERNFIFIQKRNPHVPYENGYAFDTEKFGVFPTENLSWAEYVVNTYDNAMVFEDYVINEMFNYFEKKTTQPTYVYYLSDHGEGLGKDGIWGHISLVDSVYETPFVFRAFHSNSDEYTNQVRESFYPTAYEIGLMIANRLGYEIINPNNTDDSFYVNGTDIMGRAGFLKLTKDKAENKINVELIQPGL